MLGEIISSVTNMCASKSPTIIGKAKEPAFSGYISEAGALGSKSNSELFAGIGNNVLNNAIGGAVNDDGTYNGQAIGDAVGNVLGVGGSVGSAVGGMLANKYQKKSSTVSLKVDIVKTIDYQYEQEVATHPVETGFEIQDNVVNKPLKVSMTIGVSSSPITWKTNGKGEWKFNNAYDALVAIRDAKQPVTITRPNMILSDMMMTSCKLTKSQESLSVIGVEVSFVKIVKVTTETVEIPKGIVDAAAKEKAAETAKAGGAAGKSAVGATGAVGSAGLGDMVKDEVEGSLNVLNPYLSGNKSVLAGVVDGATSLVGGKK